MVSRRQDIVIGVIVGLLIAVLAPRSWPTSIVIVFALLVACAIVLGRKAWQTWRRP